MSESNAPTWRLSGEGAKADVDALAQVLEETGVPAVGCSLVARDLWRLEAFFDAEPDLETLALGFPEEAAARVPIKVEALPDNDWVRMVLDGLPAVRAGRFIVVGAHVRDRARPGDVVVELEAGEAFGTGHHQSTLGCLEALDEIFRKNPRRLTAMMDLGCGSGVLAIAALKHPGGSVRAWGSDMDARSVAIARENAVKNGVAPRLRAFVAKGFAEPALRTLRVDLLCANILAKPLRGLAPDVARAVKPGGFLVLSGLLTEQERYVLSAYEGRDFTCVKRIRIAPWSTLILRKH